MLAMKPLMSETNVNDLHSFRFRFMQLAFASALKSKVDVMFEGAEDNALCDGHKYLCYEPMMKIAARMIEPMREILLDSNNLLLFTREEIDTNYKPFPAETRRAKKSINEWTKYFKLLFSFQPVFHAKSRRL